MRLSLSILGTEVFAIEFGDQPQDPDKGDVTTQAFGFTPNPGDQRCEPGADI